MAKRQNWIDRLKKLFISETQSKQEKVTAKLKKERRRRWLFGRLKSKCPPALPAPSLRRLRSLREAEQEQSKHAVAVAVATAAAAEAAVAAAQAAALVVRLTGNPSSCDHQTRETASVKIQTAFRGYLARRALSALKGLVKLQALIRGQAVRRQTNITLKGLQSLMKIQSQARANRMKASLINRQPHEVEDVFLQKILTNKETGDTQAKYGDRKWDGSILSKEEIIAILKKRQDAVSKRELAADYASTHQERRHARRPTISVNHELETSSTLKPTWSWLEHWAGAQTLDKDIPEVSPMQCKEGIAACNKKLHASESLSFLESAHEGKAEELQPNYFARRSFNRSGRALPKDDDSFSASPYLPSYMASTASTKAKFRSMSTPKQRHDYSDQCSSMNKERPFSPLPSVKIAPNHQRSPRLRGHACPAKHSIESELSLLTWDKHSPFR